MRKRDKLDDISQEELKRPFDYNPETGVVTRKVSVSRKCREGDVVGSRDVHGYLDVRISGTLYRLHRLIWRLVTGVTPPEDIDHVNHDKDDNRWINLRLVSPTENLRNSSRYSNNTSGHLGVYWNKPTQKWMAYIWVGGKMKGLGYFADKADAVAAREAASLKHNFHPNHGHAVTA